MPYLLSHHHPALDAGLGFWLARLQWDNRALANPFISDPPPFVSNEVETPARVTRPSTSLGTNGGWALPQNLRQPL